MTSDGCYRRTVMTAAPTHLPHQVHRHAVTFSDALGVEWTELEAQSTEPNPFFCQWALLPALRLLPDESVHLIEIRSAIGQLDGLMPLVVDSHYRGTPLPVLAVWRHLHCFLASPLLRAGAEAPALRALLAWAAERCRTVLSLPLQRLDGALYAALEGVTNASGCPFQIVEDYERPILYRPDDPERYLDEVLSSKDHRELRRKLGLLRKEGALEYEVLQRSEDVSPWLSEFLALEASGWKGEEGTALANDAMHRAMFEQIVRGAHRTHQVRMQRLRVGSKSVAMRVEFISGGEAALFKVAYDESMRRYSPGMVLEVERIRHLHLDPDVTMIDSCTMPGNEVLERLWRGRRRVGAIEIALPTTTSRGVATLMRYSRVAKRSVASHLRPSAQ